MEETTTFGAPAASREGTHVRKWEQMFAELEAYKRRTGSCDVPRARNPKLYRWAKHQRHEQQRGRLDAARAERLEGIGFRWSVGADARWRRRYDELAVFFRREGHCRVSRKYALNSQLGDWVSTQRRAGAELSEERRLLLDGIGFDWALKGSQSTSKKAPARSHNSDGAEPVNQGEDCDAVSIIANGQPLRVRPPSRDRYGTISEERGEDAFEISLDDPSVTRSPQINDSSRGCRGDEDRYYAAVAAIAADKLPRQAEEVCPASRALDSAGAEEQGGDVEIDLKDYRRGGGSRVAEGQATTEPAKAETPAPAPALKWERNFAAFSDTKRGRGYIPASHPTLGSWAKEQRRLYRIGNIDAARAARLDAAGFDWGGTHEAKWERRYRELVAYVHRNGDALVPKQYPDNPKLGWWVANQRKRTLSEDRRRRLDEIGFEWTPATRQLAGSRATGGSLPAPVVGLLPLPVRPDHHGHGTSPLVGGLMYPPVGVQGFHGDQINTNPDTARDWARCSFP